TAEANSSGQGGGIVGVGASFVDVISGGSMTSQVDGNVLGAQNVQISATVSHTGNATAKAVAGGIASGQAAVAHSTITPTVRAFVGVGQLNLSGNLTIQSAFLSGDVKATALGTTISGLLSVGSSIATVTISPTIEASVRTGSSVVAGNSITINAQFTA